MAAVPGLLNAWLQPPKWQVDQLAFLARAPVEALPAGFLAAGLFARPEPDFVAVFRDGFLVGDF